MDASDKKLAEKVLKHLCLGSSLAGIRFGSIPQLLITDYDSNKDHVRGGQVYLNLASKWCVYPSMPDQFPESEDEMNEVSQEFLSWCGGTGLAKR